MKPSAQKRKDPKNDSFFLEAMVAGAIFSPTARTRRAGLVTKTHGCRSEHAGGVVAMASILKRRGEYRRENLKRVLESSNSIEGLFSMRLNWIPSAR